MGSPFVAIAQWGMKNTYIYIYIYIYGSMCVNVSKRRISATQRALFEQIRSSPCGRRQCPCTIIDLVLHTHPALHPALPLITIDPAWH